MLFLAVPLIFFALTDKEERYGLYREFFLYTGLAYIGSKFVASKTAPLPSGILWLIGLYFAAYAFTSQRYESQLDKIEFRYNTFTTQVAAGANFSNDRLMKILNKKIPVKPSIYRPISVYQSFVYGPNYEKFYQTYSDNKDVYFKSATEFRQEIIFQWKNMLEKADFFQADLQEVSFKKANLQGASFGLANLQGARFWKADLQRVGFSSADLKGADFWNAKLQEAEFRGADLQGAEFSGAFIKKTNFLEAKLQNAKFSDAKLQGADFSLADLQGGKFWDAKLQGVIFWRADLQKVSFDGAELQDTDFWDSKLQGANFKGAKFLTAKQLIWASNIYNLKNCPKDVIEDLRKYGCIEMLTATPDEWSETLKENRKKLVVLWKEEELKKRRKMENTK